MREDAGEANEVQKKNGSQMEVDQTQHNNATQHL